MVWKNSKTIHINHIHKSTNYQSNNLTHTLNCQFKHKSQRLKSFKECVQASNWTKFELNQTTSYIKAWKKNQSVRKNLCAALNHDSATENELTGTPAINFNVNENYFTSMYSMYIHDWFKYLLKKCFSAADILILHPFVWICTAEITFLHVSGFAFNILIWKCDAINHFAIWKSTFRTWKYV